MSSHDFLVTRTQEEKPVSVHDQTLLESAIKSRSSQAPTKPIAGSRRNTVSRAPKKKSKSKQSNKSRLKNLTRQEKIAIVRQMRDLTSKSRSHLVIVSLTL